MFTKIENEGRLFICTDIHGDKKLFDKYMDLWNPQNPKSHICFAGDLIHNVSNPNNDKSPEILDIVEKYINFPNFHSLLGNHELSHVDSSNYLYHCTKKHRNHFIKSIKFSKGKKEVHNYIEKYNNLMFRFKFALITENGLWISHTGPDGRGEGLSVKNFLWNLIEYNNYASNNVNDFLTHHNLKFMVVGHTEVTKGYKFYGKQLIINSNHHIDKDLPNYYMDIDLSMSVDKEMIETSLKLL
jgi:serine/threonine-protein phosphatase PP1 catalytic subunit